MVMYKMYVNDGYIISIAHGAANGNITEEEYRKIQEAMKNKPNAPSGYVYKLKTDLEWELCQLPLATNNDE